jgi:phosphoglycolate phosphatase
MKNVIFDFDGTLADTYDIIKTFLIEESKDKKPQPGSGGIGRGVAMSTMAVRLGISRWRWPVLFFRGRKYLGRRMEYVRPYDGLGKLVKLLDEKDRKLFVVSSNSKANIQQFLKHNELNKYFVQVASGLGARGKAQAIAKLLKKNELKKGECIYIGDQLRDIKAAELAGIEIIAVTWGFCDKEALKNAEPDCLVDSVPELKELLLKKLS